MRLELIALGLSLAVIVLLLLSSRESFSSCQTDADCPDGSICRSDTKTCCRPQKCPVNNCQLDDGCGGRCKCSGREVCFDGMCCNPQPCDSLGDCTHDDGCGGKCFCPLPQICYQGRCCQPQLCQPNDDCRIQSDLCGGQCRCPNDSRCDGETGKCLNI